MADWKTERDAKRHERAIKQQLRAAAAPITRGEVVNLGFAYEEQIASLALGLEALDTMLVEKGILKDDELLTRMKSLAKEKAAQAEAQKAAPDSKLVVPV